MIFRGDSVEIQALRANLGGGTVTAGGTIALNGMTPTRAQVAIKGEGVAVRYFEGVTVEGDFNLSLNGGADRMALQGDVNVTRALYFKDIDFGYGHITVRDGKALQDSTPHPLSYADLAANARRLAEPVAAQRINRRRRLALTGALERVERVVAHAGGFVVHGRHRRRIVARAGPETKPCVGLGSDTGPVHFHHKIWHAHAFPSLIQTGTALSPGIQSTYK